MLISGSIVLCAFLQKKTYTDAKLQFGNWVMEVQGREKFPRAGGVEDDPVEKGFRLTQS